MLQFAQPWILIGLGTLALPFIIHRISRLRAQPLRFPSIRFIDPAPLPRHGRRRIRDWLLLALRTLMLLLLIAAFAGARWLPPAGEDDAAGSAATAGTAWLLIDQSASMQGWDHPQALRTALAQWFRDNPGWNAGATVFAGSALRSIPVADNPRAFIEDLDTQTPLLQEARPQNALVALRREATRNNANRVVIFSDFQSANWNGVNFGALEGLTVGRVRVGAFPGTNRFIASALAYPAGPDQLRILVDVGQSGGPAGTFPLTLTLDGTTHTREVDLEDGDRAQLVFELPLPDDPRATVEIPADAFDADNRREFWAGEAPPARIVILNAPEDQSADEGFFVARALEAAGAGQWLAFEPVTIGSRFLTAEFLQSAAALFIPARAAAAADTPWDLIAAYVADGGYAVMSLDFEGARALRNMQVAGVAEIQYSDIRGRQRELGQRFSISHIQPGSSLARVFSGDARRDLLLVDLRRHIVVEGIPEETVLLASDRAEPLLFTRAHGSGRFVLSTFPWDTSWSDFPLRNCFVPVVREVFADHAAALPAIVRVAPGDPLPDGFIEPQRFSATAPGLYRFEERPIEVVVPLSESLAEARTDFPANVTGAEPTAAQAGAVDPTRARAGIDLRPWLLLGVLALLLSETLVAAWMQRHSTSHAQPEAAA